MIYKDEEKKVIDLKKIWKDLRIVKVFNSIPNITSNLEKNIYTEFIDLWDENKNKSGFFKRETIDTSSIKNIYDLSYDELKSIFIVKKDKNVLTFQDMNALWNYFDEIKNSVVFYCHNFSKINIKIKLFFENNWFKKNNGKILLENQWKYIEYKNCIDGFILNRSKQEDEFTHRWQLIFLPIEDKNFQENGYDKLPILRDHNLYLTALEILTRFIIVIYSQNKDNLNAFKESLEVKNKWKENLKIEKETERKINSLFTNRSETKCMRSIIWLSLIKINDKFDLANKWAEKDGTKINDKTLMKWLEIKMESEYYEIIEELKKRKQLIINMLKKNYPKVEEVILSPNFDCDFKETSVAATEYAIINKTLVSVNYDDHWVFSKKYLWDLLVCYFLNNIKDSRDQKSYKIEKIQIFNPRFANTVEVKVDDLNIFYKKHFFITLDEVQKYFRKVLNGE